jgi:hypothetical protein
MRQEVDFEAEKEKNFFDDSSSEEDVKEGGNTKRVEEDQDIEHLLFKMEIIGGGDEDFQGGEVGDYFEY